MEITCSMGIDGCDDVIYKGTIQTRTAQSLAHSSCSQSDGEIY